MILIDILEEHLEEADFLWQQRENALKDRVYNLDDLAELEERLLAHLDGLVLGEKEAWKLLLEPKLAGGEIGEVFAAAFAALESGNAERIDLIQKMFGETEGLILDGIRHALRHTAYPNVEKKVQPYLDSEKGITRSAAIDVLSFRRFPLELNRLHAFLNEKDPVVVAAALSAVGRLRMGQLKFEVETALEDEYPDIRLEAISTGLLLGSDRALSRCRREVLERSQEASRAIILIGLAGHQEDLPLLVNALGDASLARSAIISLGLLGNIGAMEPLIHYSSDPKLSRVVGEAICQTTGVGLEKEKLINANPIKPESKPQAEDDDDFVDDPDEGLPLPDPSRLESWWKSNASRFDKNMRYRKGKAYSPQVLIEILQGGSLPERYNAAFELALMNPSYSLLETCALTARQRKVLTDFNILLNGSRGADA